MRTANKGSRFLAWATEVLAPLQADATVPLSTAKPWMAETQPGATASMSQTFSSSSCRCGLMLTLTTNLAVWMSAVTDESVHKAHSKLKKNMTEEIFRWLLKGNLPLCEAIWSREISHQVEIVPLQVRFCPFSEGLFGARFRPLSGLIC